MPSSRRWKKPHAKRTIPSAIPRSPRSSRSPWRRRGPSASSKSARTSGTAPSCWPVLRGPDGHVVTIEKSHELCEVARGYIERAGLSKRVEVREASAVEALGKLEGMWDLAYIDCVKEEYPKYSSRSSRRSSNEERSSSRTTCSGAGSSPSPRSPTRSVLASKRCVRSTSWRFPAPFRGVDAASRRWSRVRREDLRTDHVVSSRRPTCLQEENRRVFKTTRRVFKKNRRVFKTTTTCLSRRTVVSSQDDPMCLQEEPTCLQEEPMCLQEDPTCRQEEPSCLQDDPSCLQEEPSCRQDDPTCLQEEPTCLQDDPTCLQDDPS